MTKLKCRRPCDWRQSWVALSLIAASVVISSFASRKVKHESSGLQALFSAQGNRFPRHVLRAHEPEIPGAGEPRVAAPLQGPMLGAPDFVDGVVEMFDDVGLVEHDLVPGLRQGGARG